MLTQTLAQVLRRPRRWMTVLLTALMVGAPWRKAQRSPISRNWSRSSPPRW